MIPYLGFLLEQDIEQLVAQLSEVGLEPRKDEYGIDLSAEGMSMSIAENRVTTIGWRLR